MRRSGAAHATEILPSRSGSDAAASVAAVVGTVTSMELPAQDQLSGTEGVRRGVALRPGQSHSAAPVSSS